MKKFTAWALGIIAILFIMGSDSDCPGVAGESDTNRIYPTIITLEDSTRTTVQHWIYVFEVENQKFMLIQPRYQDNAILYPLGKDSTDEEYDPFKLKEF